MTEAQAWKAAVETLAALDGRSRTAQWRALLPQTLEFEGRAFERRDLQDAFGYFCDDFFPADFSRRGLYVTAAHTSDPPHPDVVTTKLEIALQSLASYAERERAGQGR